VPYSYYHRLSARKQQIYRASDRVTRIELTDPAALRLAALALADALSGDDRKRVQQLCNTIANGIGGQLEVPRVTVKVLARRPSQNWGELHGLYENAGDGTAPRITVWMRTAKRRQVVAFRTFLRTLLHEVCHHLDYEFLKLADSLHTEGFYQRENSLFVALTGAPGPRPVQRELF